MRPTPVFLAASLGLILLPFLLSACARARDASAPPEPVPPDLRIVVGAGGGFTGRYQGNIVEADGTVQQWAGYTEEDGAEVVGTLSAEQMDALWQRVRDAAFFDQPAGEPGNITAFMEVTANGKTHRVAWVPNPESRDPLTGVPALSQSVSDTIREETTSQ